MRTGMPIVFEELFLAHARNLFTRSLFFSLNRYAFLLFSLLSVLGCSAEEIVSQAAPFKVSLSVQVPKEAIRSLKTYLDLLIASRPLPMDYLLESYSFDAKRGELLLSGRVMRGGRRTLFFGTFVWENTVVAFPPIEITATPLQEISFSGKDILLPFPELSFQETKGNVMLRKSLVESYLSDGELVLRGQRHFRDGLVGFLFLLVTIPILIFFMERKVETWRSAQRIISPKEELSIVKKSRDWTRLLALLQRLSGKGDCLTSYELAEVFTMENRPGLARSALLIERHGYLREGAPQQFDEAIHFVRESMNVVDV